MNLFSKIRYKLANRNNHSKIAYLRSRGGVIGHGTRLLCTTDAFGTEPYLISVGSDTLFSSNVSLLTHDGGVKVLNDLHLLGDKRMDKMGRIRIGSHCFIGAGSKIMPGVTIGDYCVIGAGAIVTKDVPDRTVVAGVPAKRICSIEEYAEKARDRVYPTIGMPYDEKRRYLEEHIID